MCYRVKVIVMCINSIGVVKGFLVSGFLFPRQWLSIISYALTAHIRFLNFQYTSKYA